MTEWNCLANAVAVIALVFVVAAGCSREKPQPARPEQPKTFSLAETNVVVTVEELPDVEEDKEVRANFNADNLEDIAIIQEGEDGRSKISIFCKSP